MNQIILIGRLTRNPEIKDGNTKVAKYSIAVDRKFKREGEPEADFFNCTAFGKTAEFAEKYFRKGTKICVTGRIETGSYTNKDGVKVYTTEVVVEDQEFAESKNSGSGDFSQPAASGSAAPVAAADGFMNIPDGIDEELPFN